MTWRELWRMWIGKRSDAWDRAASILSILSADNVPPATFHPFERHKTATAGARNGSVALEYNKQVLCEIFAPFNRR